MPKNRDYTGLVRTPSSMAWLIKERSRLKGRVEHIDRLLKTLPIERKAAVASLRSLDKVIPLHEVKVDPEAIKGRRPHRPRLLPPGKLTAGILDALRTADGAERYTSEIASHAARLAQVELAGPLRYALNDAVKKRLQGLRAKGVVRSLHVIRSGSREEGRWVLVPPSDRAVAAEAESSSRKRRQ